MYKCTGSQGRILSTGTVHLPIVLIYVNGNNSNSAVLSVSSHLTVSLLQF